MIAGQFTDADSAFRATIGDLIESGSKVGNTSDPLGHTEILTYQFSMTSPRSRIVRNATRPLSIVPAVARFVWMISGNDRLADIFTYEPKVQFYSDDGLTVPGSSYGRRILQPRPGVNQLVGVIERLRENIDSRRAATVIWSPEDAHRVSRDVPCAFGTFYHARNEGLIATTVMRSNNAFLLLPFNIFEFSLLSEVVASEIGIPLVEYRHWAASMHILNRELDRANIVNTSAVAESEKMPAMPQDPSPLEQCRQLSEFEAKLRHAYSEREILGHLESSANILHPFWHSMLSVLGFHHLDRGGHTDSAHAILATLPAYFRSSIHLDAATVSGELPQPTLFDDLAVTDDRLPPLATVVAELERVVEKIEATTDNVSRSEFAQLLVEIGANGYGLAARSTTGGESSDRFITEAEARSLLEKIRTRP